MKGKGSHGGTVAVELPEDSISTLPSGINRLLPPTAIILVLLSALLPLNAGTL